MTHNLDQQHRGARLLRSLALVLTGLVSAAILVACSSDGTDEGSESETDLVVNPWEARLHHALAVPGEPYLSEAEPLPPPGLPTCGQITISGDYSPPEMPGEHQVWVKSRKPSGEGLLGGAMSVSSTQWNTTNCPDLKPVFEITPLDQHPTTEFRIGAHTAMNVHILNTPNDALFEIIIQGALDSALYPGVWQPSDLDEMEAIEWIRRTPANVSIEVRDTVDYLKTYDKCQGCDFTNSLIEDYSVLTTDALQHSDASGAMFRNVTFPYGMDFTGIDLTNTTFEDVTFDYPNFKGATLRGTTFTGGTTLREPDFTGAHLVGVIFTGSAHLVDPLFLTAWLYHTTFSGSAYMEGADLRGAVFEGVITTGGVSFTIPKVGMDPRDRGELCTQFRNSNLSSLMVFDPVLDRDRECMKWPMFDGSTIRPKSIDLADWLHIDFRNVIFVNNWEDRSYLTGKDLSGALLSGAAFWGTPFDLTGTNLSYAKLDGATFTATDFSNANLTNVYARGANFAGSTFTDAQLSGGQSDFSGADFVNTDLTGTHFTSATISGADFSGARAKSTDFGSTIAKSTVFEGTHILNNPLAFQNAVLTGADFASALLGGDSGEDGGGVNFNSAHLSSANFNLAQCVGCNFSQADLTSSNFGAAYLPGAIFGGANLKGAHLTNAYSTTNTDNKVWSFNLGFGEPPFSVYYKATDWNGADTTAVTTCPSGQKPSTENGCQNQMGQEDPTRTPIPPPCSPSGEDSCVAPFETLAGNGTAGYSDAEVNTPSDLVSSGDNAVYFADTENFVVRKITVGQPPPVLFAGRPGEPCTDPTGECGDGGPATSASFVEPYGLALDRDGTLYVADRGGNKIRMVTPDGIIYTLAGTGKACSDPTARSNPCGDGGDPLLADLNAPSGLWVDPLGNVYFADSDNNRIRVVTTSGIIETVAGTGESCDNPTSSCGDGMHPIYAQLTSPTRIVGDGLGNLYVADTGNHKIRKLAPDHLITTVFGTGDAGYNGTTDSLGFLLKGPEAELNEPTGLAVNRNGALFVADTGNGLIRRLSTEGYIALTAGLADDDAYPPVTYQGWNHDGKWANETKLNGPRGIAVTQRNEYVITDTANQRVRMVGAVPLD